MGLTGKAYPLYAGGGVLPTSGITEGGLYFSKNDVSNEYVVYVAEGTAPSALTRVSTVIGSAPTNETTTSGEIKSGDTIEKSFSKVQGRIKALEDASASMFEIKGSIASGKTLPTTANKGDAYRFEASGKTSDGQVYEKNDWAICTVSSSTTPTWYILQGNVDVAALNNKFNNYSQTGHTHTISQITDKGNLFTELKNNTNSGITITVGGTTKNIDNLKAKYAYSATTATNATSATSATNATSATTAADATHASKVGSTTGNTGGNYQPIYLSSGTPTSCNSYAKAITGFTISAANLVGCCFDGSNTDAIDVPYAGAAGQATLLGDTGNTVGSATNPVYISGGKAVKTTYTLGASVPKDAKFTDTTYENLPNPKILKIQLNGGTTEGTNQFSYSGSTEKNINITPSSIGAASSSHTHSNYAKGFSGVTQADNMLIFHSIDGTSAGTVVAYAIDADSANYATDAGTLNGISATGLFTELTNNTTSGITITVGGTTKKIDNLKATSATTAEKLSVDNVGTSGSPVYFVSGKPVATGIQIDQIANDLTQLEKDLKWGTWS